MGQTEFEILDRNARTVLISQNPKSGSGNRSKLIERLVEQLSRHDMIVHVIQDIDELCSVAIDLNRSRELRAVVAAGGDGTVSLLVNRLPEEIPFAVFPLGTANLLAKFLLTTVNVSDFAQTIAVGKTITLDVGKANDRLFLVVASCGYDADVVNRIHSTRKGHINYLSYGWPVIESIRKYNYAKMRFVADGKPLDEASWAFVLNVPKYAMNLKFVDRADGQDGKLDICTFRDGGLGNGLLYFFAVLFGFHRRLNSANITQFETLEIESDEPIPVQLDGDPAGCLPVTIQVVPNRLRVIVSDKWLDRN